jgi:hypothetical protein
LPGPHAKITPRVKITSGCLILNPQQADLTVPHLPLSPSSCRRQWSRLLTSSPYTRTSALSATSSLASKSRSSRLLSVCLRFTSPSLRADRPQCASTLGTPSVRCVNLFRSLYLLMHLFVRNMPRQAKCLRSNHPTGSSAESTAVAVVCPTTLRLVSSLLTITNSLSD